MIIFIVLVIITIGFFAEAIRQEIEYRDQQRYYAAIDIKIEDDFENSNTRYVTNLPTKIK